MTKLQKLERIDKSFYRNSYSLLFSGIICLLMMEVTFGLIGGAITAILFVLLGFVNYNKHSKKLKKVINER